MILSQHIISKIIVGSHLYGLQTPNSDIDVKGCFLPGINELILKKNIDSLNLAIENNIDTQYFSLHKLLELAYKGEMTVIDMIHAPIDKILINSEYWDFIRNNRSKFYTKHMSAYFGYILSQVNKYSQRGGRLKAVEEVIGYLEKCDPDSIIGNFWNMLPINKYTQFVKDEKGFELYECCGRKVHRTVNVNYALDIFKAYANGYGERAKKAKSNEIDYKAVSHAYRAVDQIDQMIEEGDITFPLKNKDKILKIKLGQVENNDLIFDDLSLKVDELQDKLNKSSLPSQVDRKFWESWLLSIYIKE